MGFAEKSKPGNKKIQLSSYYLLIMNPRWKHVSSE